MEMNICNLDFPDNYFSGVWCNAVLLHLNDKDMLKAIREIQRVLAPKGATCISLKEGIGSREVTEKFTSDQSRFYNFKTKEETVQLLEQNGLSVHNCYILNEQERFGADYRNLNWVYAFATKS